MGISFYRGDIRLETCMAVYVSRSLIYTVRQGKARDAETSERGKHNYTTTKPDLKFVTKEISSIILIITAMLIQRPTPLPRAPRP